MLTSYLIYAVILGYLGITMFLANQEQISHEKSSTVRALLYIGVSLIFLLGAYVLLIALSVPTLEEAAAQGEEVVIPQVSMTNGFIALLISGVAAAAAFRVVNSADLRLRLERWIGIHGHYEAASIVHTTAIVFTLLLVTSQVITFFLEGGTSGMAESIDEEGIPIGFPVVQALFQVLAAFLGVGYAIRRGMPRTLSRLGLRLPTRDDFFSGFGGGIALFGVLIVFSVFLSFFISVEQLEEQNQAAESLARAFSTLPYAFILSVSAGVGEEIFFRGALQPVFGNVLTSIFFALMHTQVLVSPGILLLFVISLGLGYIRSRYSTTAAIFAHFTYNFAILTITSGMS